MATIEPLKPVIPGKFGSNWNYNPKDYYGLRLFHGQSTIFHYKFSRIISNSVPCRPTFAYVPARVSWSLDCFNIRRSCLINQERRRESRTRANCQESDSKASSSEKSEAKTSEGSKSSSNSNSKTPRREKQGKSGWWKGGKWRWQPVIQAQEIGILLLQLGIVMLVMRLLRPGIPLPGSEPRTPTAFVSVPYSDFLSKINSNQVLKVEVDGVHIVFRLKSEQGGLESEAGGLSKLQESDSLIRSVAPTKRIVYSTTRPSDIKTPYEKMLENEVEFGSPDKRSGGFLNNALVSVLPFVCHFSG